VETATPAILLQVTREMVAAIEAGTVTSSVLLAIIRELSTALEAVTESGDMDMAVLLPMSLYLKTIRNIIPLEVLDEQVRADLRPDPEVGLEVVGNVISLYMED
jgi:hypothetical protein